MLILIEKYSSTNCVILYTLLSYIILLLNVFCIKLTQKFGPFETCKMCQV